MLPPRLKRPTVLLVCIVLLGVNLTFKAYSTHFVRPIVAPVGYNYIREKGDLQRMLDVVNAPKLMRNQSELRPLAEFISTPRLPPKRGSGKVRWVAINVVKSAAGHKIRRNTIRATWGALKLHGDVRMETIFIVGATKDKNLQNHIVKESSTFRDILQITALDSHSILTEKTLAGMQWVAENAPNTWIYSSADDDFVLHPTNFIRFINDTLYKDQHQAVSNTSLFDLQTSMPIICIYSYKDGDLTARKEESKWYMSADDYPPKTWPPYCRGGWYTMPVSRASELHQISRRTAYLHLDDVWITGIMRVKMLASSPKEAKNSILNTGIMAAPLSMRNNSELSSGTGEENTEAVIVSHVWGNVNTKQHKEVDVGIALMNTWKKWQPSMKKAP